MGNRFYPNRLSWLDEEPGWHLFGAINFLALAMLGGYDLVTKYDWRIIVYSHELALTLFMTIGGLLLFAINMLRWFRLRKRCKVSNA
ncbi:hypothetical protein PLCT2_01518 [Planctomycetaceae bacterium]|nr:hypothetical protein PLCT2_01518 [Planctomycetaceae bacterium]